MTGVRNYLPPLVLFLVAAGLILLFSSDVLTSQLSSNWEIRYTNLNDDLRTLALDPLDSQVLYLGSDKELLASSDGGQTWISLQSFRDNKILHSDLISEQALQSILLIEETRGRAAPPSEPIPAAEIGAPEEMEGVAPSEEGMTAEQSLAAAETTYQSLVAQLAQSEQELVGSQSKLTQAQTDYQAWTPDPLSISEVNAIPGGFIDDDLYDQLAEWINERGLSLVEGADERKKVLLDYLNRDAAVGQGLLAQVQAAEAEVAAASTQVTSLQEQVEQAGREKQQLESARAEIVSAPAPLEPAVPVAEAEMAPIAPTPPERAEGSVSGVTRIAVDPSNPDNIYVTTFDGTYKSTDKGKSWSLIYRGVNPSQSAALYLAIDPSNPETLFLGTLDGLAKSVDGGKNWERPVGLIRNEVVTAIAVHPYDSQVVLAGTQGDGIFKSTDGGTTWEQVFSHPSVSANSIHAVAFAPSQPKIIYSGTESGVFRSNDGGETWETASGMGLGTDQVHYLLVSPNDEQQVYLATADGVFGTTDGGRQWRRLTYGLSFKGSNYLAFDPFNPATVWLVTADHLSVSASLPYYDCSRAEVTSATNCEFSLDGRERHTLIIENVDEEKGTAMLEIQSEAQKLEVKLKETKEIDLDGDGKADMSITLDNLTGGVPQFTLKRTKPLAAEGAVELKPVEEIRGLEDLEPYFKAEPSWVEVQEVAARWAEVHPEMIAAWRRGASFRALLPKVELQYTLGDEWSDTDEGRSFYEREFDFYRTRGEGGRRIGSIGHDVTEGYFMAVSANIGETFEFYDSWSLFAERQAGQEQENRYGEQNREDNRSRVSSGSRQFKDWSIELEWYLGDFLYDRDQLYISREARDLVELRQDILEQVTLYYFDRKSARIDMVLNPPADPYSKLEMLLRLQQLDASLDALTGGYFTRTIKEREKEFPTLMGLSYIRTY